MPDQTTPNKRMRKRVAVIGAGLSGLTTIKELVEAGHDVFCLESNSDIGGVFSSSGSYDSVVLTVSNYFMAYSDFMPYEEKLRFWSRAEYKRYLDRYVDHFKLRGRIHFSCSVESVEKLGLDTWSVTWRDKHEKSITEECEHIAVCSGQFQKANIPDIPGLAQFPGLIMHSSEYTNVEKLENLRGKKVLCFGMGESAADVVAEIAEIAESTVLSLRRNHMFAARCGGGSHPSDTGQSRWWHSLSVANKSGRIRKNWSRVRESSDRAELRLMAAHILEAGEEPGSVVTKTERIFEAQATCNLTIKIGGVQFIEGNTVMYKSGQTEDFDAIVFCTGFTFDVPYLEARHQFKDIRECHLQMFHPTLRDSLSFIGFVRPQQGGIPLMAELQARYLAMVLSGERQIPNDLVEAAGRQADRWRREFFVTPNVFGLVNGLRYNEIVSELIGCCPPEPNPLLKPRRFAKYWFGHIWPCQYRLVGPGAREEAAENWQNAIQNASGKRAFKRFVVMMREKLLRKLPVSERLKHRPIRGTDDGGNLPVKVS